MRRHRLPAQIQGLQGLQGQNPMSDPPLHTHRLGLGLAIAALGTLALLDKLAFFDAALLRTYWPLGLVIWGVARLLRPRHAGSRWFGLALIAAGALMTARHVLNAPLHLQQWWPVAVILFGLAIALRPARGWHRHRHFETSTLDHADRVAVDARFSAVKLQNDSPSFQGGHISASFAGVELDLRSARMAGAEATLTIDSRFSGIELRVPTHWQVVVQMEATLGGVEDRTSAPPDAAHRLVVRGTAVFGGVQLSH